MLPTFSNEYLLVLPANGFILQTPAINRCDYCGYVRVVGWIYTRGREDLDLLFDGQLRVYGEHKRRTTQDEEVIGWP
jgi:hypothetical protein